MSGFWRRAGLAQSLFVSVALPVSIWLGICVPLCVCVCVCVYLSIFLGLHHGVTGVSVSLRFVVRQWVSPCCLCVLVACLYSHPSLPFAFAEVWLSLGLGLRLLSLLLHPRARAGSCPPY